MEGPRDSSDPKNARPEPIEATVLDRDGRVLYEPEHAEETSGKHSRFRPDMKVAWGTGGPFAAKSVGLVPKLLFGAFFATLLFLGLAVAGVFLAVLFVGWLARLAFSPRRR